jgi:ankyrin repeat protein
VANRFRHLVEPEDHNENDEQKGDPERTVAGMKSAKNKTKQESYRIHLPGLSLCRSLPNGNAGSLECVRLLAQAGANVNAHDNEGNTPLQETFLTDVEEELLKLGEDVNARNKDGETPIFTTVDNDAIPLFIEPGADLSIRNNKVQDGDGDRQRKRAPFDKELSARQFKVRTSVSSRLRR